MSFRRLVIESSNTHHKFPFHWRYLQKRNNESPPTPSLLKQLQPDSSREQASNTFGSMPIGDDESGLFTRTLITPKPFNRYHHLWLHKTLTNERRIKNLPIPTPNYKILPTIVCIMHHLINNGSSTLESLWRGLRPLGIIKSKRRLKRSIKKYMEKYPDTLPFVNMNAHNQATQNEDDESNSEVDTDSESEMESESGSESETDSDFAIDSDFSESDSAISTDWDSDGMQPSVYAIRPEKKDKIIAKYEKKWNALEEDIANSTQ